LFLYYSHFKYRLCKNLKKKSSGAKGLKEKAVINLNSFSFPPLSCGGASRYGRITLFHQLLINLPILRKSETSSAIAAKFIKMSE
jgi:hypothetical protein